MGDWRAMDVSMPAWQIQAGWTQSALDSKVSGFPVRRINRIQEVLQFESSRAGGGGGGRAPGAGEREGSLSCLHLMGAGGHSKGVAWSEDKIAEVRYNLLYPTVLQQPQPATPPV